MTLRLTNQEIKQSYKEILDGKETLRSKKIFMGKSLRHSEELLRCYKEAYSRRPGDRWYLGDQISFLDIRQEEREIAIIKEIILSL